MATIPEAIKGTGNTSKTLIPKSGSFILIVCSYAEESVIASCFVDSDTIKEGQGIVFDGLSTQIMIVDKIIHFYLNNVELEFDCKGRYI